MSIWKEWKEQQKSEGQSADGTASGQSNGVGLWKQWKQQNGQQQADQTQSNEGLWSQWRWQNGQQAQRWKSAYTASGIEALRNDFDRYLSGISDYFRKEHGTDAKKAKRWATRTKFFADEIEKEKQWFQKNASYFGDADAATFLEELEGYAQAAKRYADILSTDYQAEIVEEKQQPESVDGSPVPQGGLQYYTALIDDAIVHGKWADASTYLSRLTQAQLSPEERLEAVSYIDKVTDYNYLHDKAVAIANGKQVSEEAKSVREEILMLADRGDFEKLYNLMNSEKGSQYKKILLDEFGIDADSADSRADNYFGLAGQLQFGDMYSFDMLATSAESLKTQLGSMTFQQRAQTEVEKAAQSQTHSAQMDSYIRSQTAYYILDSLAGFLGVNDVGVPYDPDKPTTRYLVDYLRDECGVDLSGMTEENYRQMIRDSMQEMSKKASTMNTVLQKEGFDTDVVRQFAELIVQSGFEQTRQDTFEEWSENASTGEKILADILMLPQRTLLDPLVSFSEMISLAGPNSDTDDPNTYVPALGAASASDMVRSAATEALEKNTDWELFGVNVASFLYSAGMSAVDSAANAVSYGKFAVLAMGTRAAASEANDILARGGSREQAFQGGLAAGCIEAITEFVSIDKLLSAASTVDGLKALVKATASQAFVEGTEEMSSEILNIIVDSVNMGNLSRNSQAVQEYMTKHGMSYDEARTQVLHDNIAQIMESGAAGFVSGGMSGGTKSTANYMQNRAALNKLAAMLGLDHMSIGDMRTFVDSSLGLTKQGTEGHELATKLSEKIDKGKKPNKRDFARLYIAVSKSVDNSNVDAEPYVAEGADMTFAEEAAAAQELFDENEENRYTRDTSEDVVDQTEDFELRAEQLYDEVQELPAEQIREMIRERIRIRNNVNEDGKVRQSAQIEADALIRALNEKKTTANAVDTSGGMQNVRNTGTEAADDGSQWNAGVGTGEQVGGMAEGTAGQFTGSQGTAEAALGSHHGSAGQAAPTSARSIGVIGGSEQATLTVASDEEIRNNAMLSEIRQDAESAGARVTFFRGSLPVWIEGKQAYAAAEGLRQVDETGAVHYFIRTDKAGRDARQIYRHEAFHDLIARNPKLLWDLVEELDRAYGKQEIARLVSDYISAYSGIYGEITEDMPESAADAVAMEYLEEVFADVYAGIRRGKARADRAGEILRGKQTEVEDIRRNHRTTLTMKESPGQRLSIEKTTDNRRFVLVQEDILDGIPKENWCSTVMDHLNKDFSSAIKLGNNLVRIDKDSREEYLYSKYSKALRRKNPAVYEDKLRAAKNADEMLTAATDWVNEGPNHKRKDNIVEFARGKMLLQVGTNKYEAEVIVGKKRNGILKLHDVVKIVPTQFEQREAAAVEAANPLPGTDRHTTTAYGESVSQNDRAVKQDFSVDEELDQEYLEAAEHGDVVNAQRLLDETAENAGYSPEEISSLGAVAYDEDGNVIPLSQRIDIEKTRQTGFRQQKFSINEEFSDELHTWLIQTNADLRRTDGGWFSIGTTSDALKSIGVKSTEIYWRKQKIGYIMEDHPEMTEAVLKKVPELLEHPAVIAKSLTQSDSIVLFGELDTDDGKKVMVALNLTPIPTGGMNAEFTLLSSAYGRSKESVRGLLQRSEILYLSEDKKRTDTWLMSLGLQLPSGQPAYGSIGRITYSGEEVNIHGKKISFTKITPREAQKLSIEDDVADLDEGFRRHMDEEDTPSGLAPDDADMPDYGALARGKKEQLAQKATVKQLRNRVKASQEGLAKLRATREYLRKHGLLDEAQQRNLDARRADIEETMQIDRAALREKDAAEKKEKAEKKKQKQQEETKVKKARESAKALKQDLLNLFSVQAGTRLEIAQTVDRLIDRMLQRGSMIYEDRKELFDVLYKHGTEVLQPDPWLGDIRSYVDKGRIYVSDEVRAEFGDDWEAFRKRAWGNRIYLTNNSNDPGIDVWAMELADTFGGQFGQSADLREELEQIVHLAEEGRAEHVSLAEAMRRHQDTYGDSVADQMAHLEEQVDRLLEKFADKAELEIKLRQQSTAALIKQENRYREMIQREAKNRQESRTRNEVMNGIRKLSKMRKRSGPAQRAEIDALIGNIDTVARSISDRGLEDLQELLRQYVEAKEQQGSSFLASPYVEARLDRLNKTQLDEMDIDSVIELGRLVCALVNSIQNSHRLLAEEQHREVKQAAKDADREIKKSSGSGGGKLRSLIENHLSAERFFGQISGWANGAMERLGKKLAEGQRRQMDYQRRAMRIFDQFLQDEKNVDWLKKAAGKDAEWISVDIMTGVEVDRNGIHARERTIMITPMMRVSLLMHSMNEDNLRHISGGGIRIPDQKLYKKGKMQEAYARGELIKLDPSVVRAIVKHCTAQEKAFAALLKTYYNGMSKDCINEVSMIMDGFERAGGENYVHIKTDHAFLAKQNDAVKRDLSVAATGSVVNERRHAQNPIILEDATTALTEHIDSISKYYGLAIPIRDLNAVMGYTFHEEDNAFVGSVMDTIGRKWGIGAEKYIDKLMADLQLPDSSSDMLSSFMTKLRGNYAKAVISANISSLAKQVTSYPVALPYVKASGLLYGVTHKADVETLERYSAVYWYRNQGNATMELSDAMKQKEFGDRLPFVFNATQKVDSFVTRRLLAACEYRVQKDLGLQPGTREEIENGTDQYWHEVAKLFNDVVLKTQSNSSVMERPQITRANASNISRFLTMFRTDAFQQFNMHVEAIGRARAANKAMKENPTEANQKRYKEAKAFAVRTLTGCLIGQLSVSLINFLVLFATFRDEDYRDEDGDLSIEQILKRIGLDTVEGYAGFVVGANYLYGVIENAVDKLAGGDETWFGVGVNALDTLNDGMEAIIDLADTLGEGDLWSGRGKIRDAAKVLAQGLGIPLTNLEKYLLSAVKWLAPEWAEKYENFWDETTKADLDKESKRTMVEAIGVIMDNRVDGLDDEEKEEIARLYAAGGSGAVPNGVPSSVTYTDEDGNEIKVELDGSQREDYRDAWKETVTGNLSELLASDAYEDADDKGKTELVAKLYSYAAVVAKSTVVPEVEPQKWVVQGQNAKDVGIPLAEYIAFRIGLTDITGEEDGETVSGLKAERQMEFLEQMGWTDRQEKEIYLDVLASEKKAADTNALLDAGLSWDQVNDLVASSGKARDKVDTILKLNVSDAVKARAVSVYAGEVESKMIRTGVKFGVKLSLYADARRNADANGNGRIDQAEAEEYIWGMDCSVQDKAYLWQMLTDAKEGKSNPFPGGKLFGGEFWEAAHEDDE